MKKVSITIIAILGLATAAMQAAACEADHWVSSVANDGAIVTLDDGTVHGRTFDDFPAAEAFFQIVVSECQPRARMVA